MSEANRVLIQPDSKVPGLEIVAPAGSPVMFRAALEAGADAVYCGLQDETNARNFPGLNFSVTELTLAAVEAKRAGVKLLVAVNTFARAGGFSAWQNAVDTVATSGAYAIIAADLGVLAYAARRWPNLRCHLSVQAAAGTADAIRFYAETFNVRRVVLPRIMAVSEIARLRKDLDHAGLDMELEAFVYGGLCVMAEGRCALSSYAAAGSPNLTGVCSPPDAVSYEPSTGGMSARLGGYTIDQYGVDQPAAYPTLCKGRFLMDGIADHWFEDPVSLNAAGMLRDLRTAGVCAVKIEGRQRGKAYVSRVVTSFRQAIRDLDQTEASRPLALSDLAEGASETVGAYNKKWR